MCDRIIYQKCPKCDGQGTVLRPSWIDGDVKTWIDTCTGGHICNLCNGSMIIGVYEKAEQNL